MLRKVKGRVSIITLNWNHYSDLTGPFIRYIEKFTKNPFGDFELIVVDQGSERSDRLELVKNSITWPWLKNIFLPFNTGFPRGNNLGLSQVSGEYVLFMNNDITINGDWLTPLMDTFDQNRKRKALVGTSLVHRGGWNEFNIYGQHLTIPYLEGWLLLFNRDLLKLVRGFNEEYGMGSMEDIEFCYRANKCGYDLISVSPLPLVHLRGATVTDGRLDQPSITKANYEPFLSVLKEEVGRRP
jgi:GT2 family glycosyltransferase